MQDSNGSNFCWAKKSLPCVHNAIFKAKAFKCISRSVRDTI